MNASRLLKGEPSDAKIAVVIMKSLMELVQIYLYLGHDGSEFAQMQIYQMLIRHMNICDYSAVVTENHTLHDLEEQIINCVREMRDNCQLKVSQTSLLPSNDVSQSKKDSSHVTPVTRTRNTAMKRKKRPIRSPDLTDGSHSIDESEANCNRVQHKKIGAPRVFELIQQRKQRKIAGKNRKIIDKSTIVVGSSSSSDSDFNKMPKSSPNDNISETHAPYSGCTPIKHKEPLRVKVMDDNLLNESGETQVKSKAKKKTPAITMKSGTTKNKPTFITKKVSECSSSSDDEIFKMLKSKRRKAGRVKQTIQSVNRESTDSDSDSDQFW